MAGVNKALLSIVSKKYLKHPQRSKLCNSMVARSVGRGACLLWDGNGLLRMDEWKGCCANFGVHLHPDNPLEL